MKTESIMIADWWIKALFNQKEEIKKMIEGKKVKSITGKLPEIEKGRMKLAIDTVLDNILKAIEE